MIAPATLRFVLKWLLCLGLLALALSRVEPSQLVEQVRRVEPMWFAAGIGLCVLNNLTAVGQFLAGLRPLGIPISFSRMVAITLVSAFYSVVLPAGMVAGGLASFYKIGRAGGRFVEAGALVVALRLLNTFLLVGAGLLAACLDPRWLGGDGRLPLLLLAAGLGLGLWPFADLRLAAWLLRILRLPESGWTGRLHEGVRALASLSGGDRLRILAWGLAVNATNLLAWVCLAHASAIHLATGTLLWIAALQGVVQMLPFTIGGLGVREVSLVALLAPYGVPAPPALLFASLILLVMLANTLLGGLLELLERPRHP